MDRERVKKLKKLGFEDKEVVKLLSQEQLLEEISRLSKLDGEKVEQVETNLKDKIKALKKVGMDDKEVVEHLSQTKLLETLKQLRGITRKELKGATGKTGKRGKTGKKGPKGEKGDKGEPGKEGKKGKDGKRGPKGKRGPRGLNGLDGLDGRDGQDGKDGKDGKSVDKKKVQKIVKKEVKSEVKNIDINTLNTRDLVIGASQVRGLKGGGSGPDFRLEVLEDNIRKSGDVQKINFGSGFDISKTTNGIEVTLDQSEDDIDVFFPNPLDGGDVDDTEGDAEFHFDGGEEANYSQIGHSHVISDVTGLQTALDAKQDNISVSDTAEIDLTFAADTLSADIVASSIDETKLDASVNASLDLADSSLQTASDSSEIDFTVTGSDITASIVAGSIDETKLDTSTNASLDLADTSLQQDGSTPLTNSWNIGATGAIQIPDNNGIQFGTGLDSSVYYDGTNLIISPKDSGTGRVRISGSIEVTENVYTNTTSVTSTPYTLTSEHVVLVADDAAGAEVTINLPAASGNAGLQFVIKKVENSYNVVVDGNASETIDGATTATLTTQYESITVVCDGSNWHII